MVGGGQLFQIPHGAFLHKLNPMSLCRGEKRKEGTDRMVVNFPRFSPYSALSADTVAGATYSFSPEMGWAELAPARFSLLSS